MNIGRKGEDIASNYLLNLGFVILTKNYHSRYGEIDIICQNIDYTIFVEVKSKLHNSISELSYRVNYSKKVKMLKTIDHYLSNHKLANQPRIDVIEVIIYPNSHKINHIENAFGFINYEFF